MSKENEVNKQRNLEGYGLKIKKYRKDLNMTAEDLAKALNIGVSSVRNWECGISRPDPEYLLQMFSILNVDPNEFFGIKGVGGSLSEDERTLLDGYRLLDDVHKEDVRSFVDTLNSKAHIRLLKRKYDQMNVIDFRERHAAAGSGSEWPDYTENEPVVLYENSAVALADEIFVVSGESMEPQFSDGDRVLVQYCEDVKIGDIGIFYAPGFGGLIKQRAYDRLHSLNPEFDDILPYEDGAKTIGKVLCKITPDMIPSKTDVALFNEAAELFGD